jgi:NADH-quinone oxidoreductase subunit L
VLGILTAWWLYLKRPEIPAVIAARVSAVYRLLLHKYWVDEIYDAVVVRPYLALSRFAWRVIDDGLIDGLAVLGTGRLVKAGSRVMSGWETGRVPTYVFVFFGGVVVLLAYVLLG